MDEQLNELLTEIRDNQRVALELQKQHLAIATELSERSRNQVSESIDLQKQAMHRFKAVSWFSLPAILFCIGLIVYLIVNYL